MEDIFEGLKDIKFDEIQNKEFIEYNKEYSLIFKVIHKIFVLFKLLK